MSVPLRHRFAEPFYETAARHCFSFSHLLLDVTSGSVDLSEIAAGGPEDLPPGTCLNTLVCEFFHGHVGHGNFFRPLLEGALYIREALQDRS